MTLIASSLAIGAKVIRTSIESAWLDQLGMEFKPNIQALACIVNKQSYLTFTPHNWVLLKHRKITLFELHDRLRKHWKILGILRDTTEINSDENWEFEG